MWRGRKGRIGTLTSLHEGVKEKKRLVNVRQRVNATDTKHQSRGQFRDKG